MSFFRPQSLIKSSSLQQEPCNEGYGAQTNESTITARGGVTKIKPGKIFNFTLGILETQGGGLDFSKMSEL